MIHPAELHPFVVTPETVPQTDRELMACLASWEWRIFSGQLYKITTKGDDASDDEPDIAVPFIPNEPQRLLLANLHTRNTVLKARQMGFSTLIDILALDHAMFIRDQECVIIAQTDDAAKKLYRKKILFAYDNLPPAVKEAIPTVKRTEKMIVFNNGSSVEVTSSARGGTPHFLHISEFGKIAATNPHKAAEITTGSMQGVPKTGIIFIESTAEGQSGAFYENAKRAEANLMSGRELGPLEYRFHFFPWFMDVGYRLDTESAKRVRISAKEHEYFDIIEGKMDVEITLEQRAWYVQKRDTDFAAHPDLFWREYPSTPEECWQASTEGKYYAKQIAIARREGRITKLPTLRHVPVDWFWDLGASDDTAIWGRQVVGPWRHWIRFHEESGAGYFHFINWIEDQGFLVGANYLPHDAEQKRQKNQLDPSDFALTSPQMILQEMRPSWTWRVVPRVQTIQHGIDVTRQAFAFYRFDEEGCKEGLLHLENYSRKWNNQLQCWDDHPRHDEHSHAADAIRQEAQAFEQPTHTHETPKGEQKRRRERPDALTA
jgi:hypothetical protein